MAHNELTPEPTPSIVPEITPWETYPVPNFDLDTLEQQVEELIRTCHRLTEENASLRTCQEQLVAERAELIEKTELARNRVETMLLRLKSMEEEL